MIRMLGAICGGFGMGILVVEVVFWGFGMGLKRFEILAASNELLQSFILEARLLYV